MVRTVESNSRTRNVDQIPILINRETIAGIVIVGVQGNLTENGISGQIIAINRISSKITDSDENEMLEELKMLNDILKEVEIGIGFDAELFEQTVDSITVDSNERLTFHLAGGISLPEKIREKGRCYQA